MLLSVRSNVWTFGLAVLLKAHSHGGFFSEYNCDFESNYWRSQSHSLNSIIDIQPIPCNMKKRSSTLKKSKKNCTVWMSFSDAYLFKGLKILNFQILPPWHNSLVLECQTRGTQFQSYWTLLCWLHGIFRYPWGMPFSVKFILIPFVVKRRFYSVLKYIVFATCICDFFFSNTHASFFSKGLRGLKMVIHWTWSLEMILLTTLNEANSPSAVLHHDWLVFMHVQQQTLMDLHTPIPWY